MRVGIIGFGKRVQWMFSQIQEYNLGIELAAICDINNDKIKKQFEQEKISYSKIAFYEDADEMLDTEKLDGVMIGTRCSLHTRLAVKVLSRNLPLFLEKPVATNMEDLLLLKKACDKSKSKVVVSFPLRTSPIVSFAKEILDSGKIGTVEHVQAINNVPYGRIYYHNWYRDENETQGLFLQKSTHDFDYINYLVGIGPVAICAMNSKQVYKGNKPAGLRCKDCDEQETCQDSPFYLKHFSFGTSFEDTYGDDLCGFAVDTGNEDSGSALIRYETGMHACYSQNFFARKGAEARGARLFGYKGTLEFDWYKDEIKVFMHHSPVTESYKFDSKAMSHFGGDSVLAYNFINVMRGREESISDLDAGMLSACMCLMAKESAETGRFMEIDLPINR